MLVFGDLSLSTQVCILGKGDVLGVYGQCFPTRPTMQIDRLEPESHFNAKFGPWEQVNVSLSPP